MICFDCKSPLDNLHPIARVHPDLIGTDEHLVYCSGCGLGVIDWYFYQLYKSKRDTM